MSIVGIDILTDAVVNAAALASVLGITPRRVQQLTSDGVLIPAEHNGHGRVYALCQAIQAYSSFLADGCTVPEQKSKLDDLKAQKLTAEIALKESQADLHKLKTAIAEGKYLPVEEVKLDYEQFFVTFKKFALAIPQRVGAIVAGYGDPVIARKVEADINHEVTEMLSTFVVAAQVRPETATR